MKLLKRLVLIEKPKEKSKTNNGIYLPEVIKDEKPTKGKVLAIGSEVQDVKVGQMVLFKKYALEEYDEGFIVDERDILGVFN